MKRFLFTLICITVSVFGMSQGDGPNPEKKPFPFRLEMEPTSYIAKGWSLLGSYAVDKERNLSFGLYTIASTLPSGINSTMFWNAEEEDVIQVFGDTAKRADARSSAGCLARDDSSNVCSVTAITWATSIITSRACVIVAARLKRVD